MVSRATREEREMTFKEAEELAADLREFADFIEKRGVELPGGIYIGGIYQSLYDDDDRGTAKEQAKRVARVLAKGALVEKRHNNYSLDLVRTFGTNIKLIYSINREKFCKKVVTGTKVVPAYVREEHTEETFEWVCDDPVLAG
jgi:hypothetical protein